MGTAAPTVSVVMAARDAAPWVGAAVESVLGQTFGDLELIVVDDGSRDGTADVLAGVRDPRIVRLRNEQPAGAAAARNRALEVARGGLLAIHDADDLSRPERIAAQVEFLSRRPDVAACGTRVATIDASCDPVEGVPAAPTSDALVAWQFLLFSNPIAHSSAMVRREVVRRTGPYDANLEAAHDREFLGRVFRLGRLAVLDEELLSHRVHDRSLGARLRPLQRASSLRVRRDLLRWLLGPGAPADAVLHWYDTPIPAEGIEPLTRLLLLAHAEIVRRFVPSPAETAALHDDLVARLESMRRRDGRIAARDLTRAYWRTVLPRPVARLLRSALGRRR